MKPALPPPGRSFAPKKQQILASLARPDPEYADASPKGSVDAGLRGLIDRVNAREGLVTTSSCAGRVSVYLEGPKVSAFSSSSSKVGEKEKEEVGEGERNGTSPTAAAEAVVASSSGGKGGGEWLFVSHDPVREEEVEGDGEQGYERLLLGGREVVAAERGGGFVDVKGTARLIHFKFEPMILHVLTASVEHAQLVIQAGMEAGFRETGAVSLVPRQGSDESTPMVAVRSMGLSFESLIAAEINGVCQLMVPPQYLKTLVQIANERFVENQKRIARFDAALEAAFTAAEKRREKQQQREDSQTRRERKRQEGLRRREELEQEKMRMAQERERREDLAEDAVIEFVLHEQHVV